MYEILKRNLTDTDDVLELPAISVRGSQILASHYRNLPGYLQGVSKRQTLSNSN